jgi:predicted small secreted protein
MNMPGRPGRATAVVVAVLAASAVAAGCGTVTGRHVRVGGDPTVIVVRDDANGKTLKVRVGDRIELILSSTYWNLHGNSAPRVLRQEGPVEVLARPPDCPDVPGVGCTPEQVNFTALADGTAIIKASRVSCGEALRCAPSKTQFAVTLVVGASG